MKTLKNYILVAGILVLANMGLSAQETKPAAQKIKYEYTDTTIADFEKVTILNAINVVYKQSETNSGKVRIYAPEGKDVVSLVSKNGELCIKYGRGYKRTFGVIMVYIHSKELSKVHCSLGGNFTTEGLVSGKSLKLKVNNRSQIRCNNLMYEEIKAKRGVGRGDILLSGKSSKATYSIIGRGEINAENMIADEVDCKIFGLGNIECHVDKEIAVRRIGRGAAYCKGNLPISGKNPQIRTLSQKEQ